MIIPHCGNIVYNIVHNNIHLINSRADNVYVSKSTNNKRLGVRGKPLKDPNDWGLLRIRMSKEQEVDFQKRLSSIAEAMNKSRAPGDLMRNNHLAIMALEIGLERLKKSLK